MDGIDTVPTTALMRVPSWLWGGKPSHFFSEARLHGRRIDAQARYWRVQTDESWRHTRPSLITVCHLAGPTLKRTRFEILRRMAEDDKLAPASNDLIVKEINRLRKRAEETGSTADAFAYSQLQTIAVQSSDLPEVVSGVYENLLQVGLVSDPGEKVFANAGVHVFQRRPALIHRLKIASVWLRISLDEKFFLEDISQIQAAAMAGEGAFSSSSGLYDGIYTLDAYIGPLLGALSLNPPMN